MEVSQQLNLPKTTRFLKIFCLSLADRIFNKVLSRWQKLWSRLRRKKLLTKVQLLCAKAARKILAGLSGPPTLPPPPPAPEKFN